MKKLILLTASIVLLFVSCASSPAPTEDVTPPPVETPQEEVQEEVKEEVKEEVTEIVKEIKTLVVLDGAQEYKVKYGDTLSKIAKNFYGVNNGYYFPLIMLATEEPIDDPDVIEPGMTLIIPDLQKNLDEVAVHQNMKTGFSKVADLYKNKPTSTSGRTREELLKIVDSL